jgi:hypothetical protein
VLWLTIVLTVLPLAIFPRLLDRIAGALGVESDTSLVFFLALMVLLAICPLDLGGQPTGRAGSHAGRLLQRHTSAGSGLLRLVRERPAQYVLFDLVRVGEGNLTGMRLAQRRTRLEQLLAGGPAQLPLCPQTTDIGQARVWLADWSAAGIEGVVAKRLDGLYVGGQRGWRKLRARAGTETVVGGVTGSVHEPQTLLQDLLTVNDGLSPVQWTGYIDGRRAYQGALVGGEKVRIQKAFRGKASTTQAPPRCARRTAVRVSQANEGTKI